MVRKGIASKMVIYITFAAISLMVMAVSIDSVISYGGLWKEQTVKNVGERIESSVHAADSLKQGKIQLNLRGQSGYVLYSEDGDKFIRYRHRGDEITRELQDIQDVSYTIEMGEDDEAVREVCIVKEEGFSPKVQGGKCHT